MHRIVVLGGGHAGLLAAVSLIGRAAVWYKETVSSAPWPTFRRTLRYPGLAMLG